MSHSAPPRIFCYHLSAYLAARPPLWTGSWEAHPIVNMLGYDSLKSTPLGMFLVPLARTLSQSRINIHHGSSGVVVVLTSFALAGFSESLKQAQQAPRGF